MKRIISAALALVCLLMLAGCGGGNLTDEEEYRKSEEESWGFQFIGEVPEYAQAEALPMADAFAGGSGTEEDPYQIANAAQLARLAYISNVKKDSELYREKFDYLEAWYILTDDIAWNDTSDFENWTEQAPQYAWDPILHDRLVQRSFRWKRAYDLRLIYDIRLGADDTAPERGYCRIRIVWACLWFPCSLRHQKCHNKRFALSAIQCRL